MQLFLETPDFDTCTFGAQCSLPVVLVTIILQSR